MFAPSVGTMLNGEHAFATCGGPAWRRRQRRLRAFRRFVLWHSKMEIAAALHHTSGLRSTAVEPSAPYVVGSLPPVEEFSGPVYDQVHQELFTASVSTENIAEIPVVQEQVIVPAVVDSLPLDDEFTGQCTTKFIRYSLLQVTENFAKIPVVHEQVIAQDIPDVIAPLPPAQEFSAPVYGQVGLRPERLVDARGPQRCGRTVPSVGAPVLAVQSLRGIDGVDNTAAKFLLQQALKKKKKEEEEEEERRKRKEELRADEKKKLEARERKRAKALKGWDEEALWQLNRRIQAGTRPGTTGMVARPPHRPRGRGRRGGRKNFLVAALDVDNGSVLFLVRSSSTPAEACAGLGFSSSRCVPLGCRQAQMLGIMAGIPRIWQSLVRCSLWFDSRYMLRQSTVAIVSGAFRIQRNALFASGLAR